MTSSSEFRKYFSDISPSTYEALLGIYEEVMWLATRPNVTPSRARAWYTHVMAESLKRELRHFTRRVSQRVIVEPDADLRLEHYQRIQTTLSQLIKRHHDGGELKPREFVRTIVDFERVHIVTRWENDEVRRTKGNYRDAGIKLVAWQRVPVWRREDIWTRALKGKVANATEFKPKPISKKGRTAL